VHAIVAQILLDWCATATRPDPQRRHPAAGAAQRLARQRAGPLPEGPADGPA